MIAYLKSSKARLAIINTIIAACVFSVFLALLRSRDGSTPFSFAQVKEIAVTDMPVFALMYACIMLTVGYVQFRRSSGKGEQ